jgi:hypothetical protein
MDTDERIANALEAIQTILLTALSNGSPLVEAIKQIGKEEHANARTQTSQTRTDH